MRNRPNFEKVDSTTENPIYVVQQSDISRSSIIELLLGEKLTTTSLALGKFSRDPRKKGSQKLHIKSDTIGGIRLTGVIVSDSHDLFGNLNPNNFSSFIFSCSSMHVIIV